ncbi:transglutaminase family protein [Hydrogenophaga sp.]|uniref:transglutaminase family protein n=1 Tax=Hydrogenophaga sp. TaxID=1904254 RepID=UPI0019C095DC|nr:transglutaminase family protein [Hydrogenophaga sp.]MBD3893677.1 transglutaminase family protein [Hydrogenophaga sp.]
MKLRVIHRTSYHYQDNVDLAQHMVHLTPVDSATQRVLSHALRIDPEPATRHAITDAFGNHRTYFSLQAPHETLSVEADSLIHTQTATNLCEHPPWQDLRWEQVREHFRYRAQARYDAASEFLFASPRVPRDDRFAAFVRPAFAPGQPLLEATRALMERIHTELSFDAASTDVNTPALQALEQGKGVCQDFAHIMLGCLRSLGLAARYVSGYLLTQPPPGKARLLGADASHAWVSVYLPRPHDAGASTPAPTPALAPADSDPPSSNKIISGAWFDFDPTNDRWGWGSPGEDYVRLASGRDFSDVSPMRGVIQSGAAHTLDVAVTVAPAAEPGPASASLSR